MAVEILAPAHQDARHTVVEPTPMIVRRHSTVVRLHLASVAKMAILFWSCVGLLAAGVLVVMRTLLDRYGAVENAESFVRDVTGAEDFRIVSSAIVVMLIVLAALFVLVATTLTIVAAAFYNALARMFGGIEMTVTEEFGRMVLPVDQQGDGVRSNGHAAGGSVSKS